jgi:2',3'-cyclic-nucleotide 2'-phosphodiesterase (5'-nucleotidase family)
MKELLARFNAPVLCANFFDMGAEKPYYKPYMIKRYGTKRVAYVGVCTPETMHAESYSFFDKEGNQLYDLKTESTYTLVQQAADEARREGTDYVVMLSHLGETVNMTGVNSPGLVNATKGIDVVLDGHSHSVIEHQYEKNLDGKSIAITQTGTQFANIGKLLITRDGHISTTLIPIADVPFTNQTVASTTDSVKAEMNKVTSRKIGASEYDLTINGPDGKRLVRSGETNLGDLVADAFRVALDANIGLANGGGIRNSIPAGEITVFNAVDVQPFDNHLCLISATGAQIVNMLQTCTQNTPAEDGNFPQVSGMKFTIHTVSHTVSDVYIYNTTTSQYEPIDPNKSYTLSVADYVSSGGYYGTQHDCQVLSTSSLLTRDAMVEYIEKHLGGTTGETYRQPQGRITIVAD